MDRRKAIGRIILIGGGGLATYAGYKLWDWNKTPDLAFLDQHKNLIAALAEAIIPTTDSPGAKEAAVADFIIIMVKDCTEIKSQNRFIDGLKELKSYTLSSFNKTYEQCTDQQKEQVLKYFEDMDKQPKGIVGKAEKKFFGEPFFETLKTLTVKGYCTSEAGATKGLSYLYIPGKFVGCMPMQPGQHAWATN
ncbi:MAG: gluconate 2-dehydrogenase subunit 3 family protein [Bacteroidetes bacterium]|nr:gluconate 2-dehydrogenase subunit 3 family protein [Bacteroidota bacterium]